MLNKMSERCTLPPCFKNSICLKKLKNNNKQQINCKITNNKKGRKIALWESCSQIRR